MCLCVTLLRLGVYVYVCYLAQARGMCVCVLPCSSLGYVYLLIYVTLLRLGVCVSVCYLAHARGVCVCLLPCLG